MAGSEAAAGTLTATSGAPVSFDKAAKGARAEPSPRSTWIDRGPPGGLAEYFARSTDRLRAGCVEALAPLEQLSQGFAFASRGVEIEERHVQIEP